LYTLLYLVVQEYTLPTVAQTFPLTCLRTLDPGLAQVVRFHPDPAGLALLPCTRTSKTHVRVLNIGALLTDSAKTWYLANKQKCKPDPLSGWTMWVTSEDFLKDFIATHENKNEVHEAKRNLQMEYQKSGERMKKYVSRMRTHNMLANLP